MLSEVKKTDALVLQMLKKKDGTEVEPIIDCSAGFFVCELIDDELYLMRNAFPEEMDAYREREEQRALAAEEEKERKAAERAEKEKATRARILETIQPHKDGVFRLLDTARERTFEFKSAEDAAEFASWNVEREFEPAPEPPEPVAEAGEGEDAALETAKAVAEDEQQPA